MLTPVNLSCVSFTLIALTLGVSFASGTSQTAWAAGISPGVSPGISNTELTQGLEQVLAFSRAKQQKPLTRFESSPLYQALLRGDAASVRQALNLGANPNLRDERGTPLLIVAISLSPAVPTDSILALIENEGTHLNARDTAWIGDDRTALHMASSVGTPEIVRALLLRGLNPNSVNRFGETPLHFAAARNHLAVTRLLLASGANPNARMHSTLNSPLHLAARNGAKDVARELVLQGASHRLKNVFGKSAADFMRKPASNSANGLLIRWTEKEEDDKKRGRDHERRKSIQLGAYTESHHRVDPYRQGF